MLQLIRRKTFRKTKDLASERYNGVHYSQHSVSQDPHRSLDRRHSNTRYSSLNSCEEGPPTIIQYARPPENLNSPVRESSAYLSESLTVSPAVSPDPTVHIAHPVQHQSTPGVACTDPVQQLFLDSVLKSTNSSRDVCRKYSVTSERSASRPTAAATTATVPPAAQHAATSPKKRSVMTVLRQSFRRKRRPQSAYVEAGSGVSTIWAGSNVSVGTSRTLTQSRQSIASRTSLDREPATRKLSRKESAGSNYYNREVQKSPDQRNGKSPQHQRSFREKSPEFKHSRREKSPELKSTRREKSPEWRHRKEKSPDRRTLKDRSSEDLRKERRSSEQRINRVSSVLEPGSPSADQYSESQSIRYIDSPSLTSSVGQESVRLEQERKESVRAEQERKESARAVQERKNSVRAEQELRKQSTDMSASVSATPYSPPGRAVTVKTSIHSPRMEPATPRSAGQRFLPETPKTVPSAVPPIYANVHSQLSSGNNRQMTPHIPKILEDYPKVESSTVPSSHPRDPPAVP